MHRVSTAPGIWKPDALNHLALAWDRAYGLRLYHNGAEAASNWGEDAWWTTQIPGLFHLPLYEATWDELWILDRPLAAEEVARLMETNEPPAGGEPRRRDAAAEARLRAAFIGSRTDMLAEVAAGSPLLVTEHFPLRAGDGMINAPYVMDGMYQLAWPQDYGSFTSILGDSDFKAEKVDFELPEESVVNYVTFEGNLDGVRLLCGPDLAGDAMGEVLAVENEGQQFFGSSIEPRRHVAYRIPFVKSYGSPPGYAPGMHLALTGDTRVDEVGFYHLAPLADAKAPGETRRLDVGGPVAAPDDGRYGYALRTVNDARSALVHRLAAGGAAKQPAEVAAFDRVNLVSEPLGEAAALVSLDIDLTLAVDDPDGFVIMRLHDPGVPARIWNTLVFRLADFRRQGRLQLRLDCLDIRMAANDRIWIDLAFSGDARLAGGNEPSGVELHLVPLVEADPNYGRKAIQSALGNFTKIYNWYYPWTMTAKDPDPENPVTFGGFYDIVTAPKAVVRTDPEHDLANKLIDLALVRDPLTTSSIGGNWMDPYWHPDPEVQHAKSRSVWNSWEQSSIHWPPMKVAPAAGVPEWAFYQNHYLEGFEKIVHWWADHQNPDGQVGGGWNDDVLVVQKLAGPLLYMGDTKSRRMFDRVFEGVDRTLMFADGYCRIDPIDEMHSKDLVRSRYEGFLFEPGSVDKLLFSFETGRWFGRPEITPMNYFDGATFKADHDLVRYYWGEQTPRKPFEATREEATELAKTFAPAINDVLFFRYTDAGMFTDSTYIPGHYASKRIIVGGECGPFTNLELLDNLDISVSWESGGAAEIPRWVEYASDEKFTAHLYSFALAPRDVTARLFRLRKGVYRVTLSTLAPDGSVTEVYRDHRTLSRFDTVTVAIRPGREYVLNVELEKALPTPGPLPDLALHAAREEGPGIAVDVYNFGNAAARYVLVRLEDASGGMLAEERVAALKSADDFDPARATVSFKLPAGSGEGLRISVDPDQEFEEIFERNNTVVWRGAGSGCEAGCQ